MLSIPTLRRAGRQVSVRAPGAARGDVGGADTDGAASRNPVVRVASAILTLAVIAGVVFLWPTWLGGSTRMTMVAGRSMEPTYRLGDLLVVRGSGGYEIGDIVVFEVPEGNGEGTLVVHRIHEVDGDGRFITQGDNRDTPDQWPLTDDDIVGRPILRIPAGGRVIMGLRQPWSLAVLAGLAVMILLWPRRRADESDSAPADDEPGEVAAAVPVAPVAPVVTVATVAPVATVEAAAVDDTRPMPLPVFDLDPETHMPVVGPNVGTTTITPELMAAAEAWLEAQLVDDAEAWVDAQLADSPDAWVDAELAMAAVRAIDPIPARRERRLVST